MINTEVVDTTVVISTTVVYTSLYHVINYHDINYSTADQKQNTVTTIFKINFFLYSIHLTRIIFLLIWLFIYQKSGGGKRWGETTF